MKSADRQSIRVEVAFATAEKQFLAGIDLPSGAAVADAISAASRRLPDIPQDTAGLKVGIWGRIADRAEILSDGDRVEIYRPLKLDPREARRRYAAAGMTMAHHQPSEPEG